MDVSNGNLHISLLFFFSFNTYPITAMNPLTSNPMFFNRSVAGIPLEMPQQQPGLSNPLLDPVLQVEGSTVNSCVEEAESSARTYPTN